MIDKNLIINLNKPKGMTSQQAVTKVKKLLKSKKAGHAGTLDPIATGVLLVCTDEATKVTRFLMDTDKEYIAVMKFGERTDTYDTEGEIIQKVEHFSVNENDVKAVLEKFRGTIKQTPPMFSAIKISGKPLYKLARRGLEVEREHRTINIYELEMIRLVLPYLEIRVLCSKGSYIRSLCDDVGTALGIGAHMVALKRTRAGNFRLEDSADINELPDKNISVNSIDAALSHLNDVILSPVFFHKALNGMQIAPEGLSELPVNSYLRLKDPEGRLFAIGKNTGVKIQIERRLNILPQKE